MTKMQTPVASTGYERTVRRTPGPDHAALYALAASQSGYFTSRQARQAGFDTALLVYHTHTGKFQRVARGVYRLNRFPASRHELLTAAWLAAGPRAVVSRESALAFYELSDVLPDAVHLTVPRTTSRRKTGATLHTDRIGADEITWREGLRITTVPRTIADVAAAGMPEDLVFQAIGEALRRGMTAPDEMEEMASRRGGRAARLLRQALHREGAA